MSKLIEGQNEGDSDAFRVLVLEDEMIVGMDLALSIEEAGYVVMGPFKSLDRACRAIEEDMPDFALLDINLGRGETSEEIAELLTERGCPFIFLTGYGAMGHPLAEKYEHAECVTKPADISLILELIAARV